MNDGLRIIIVEDSADDAYLIEEEIKKAGYQLTAVRVDSADALRAALMERDWDLVLSDHSMPGFSAPAALTVLHESGSTVPFIIVSGAIEEVLAVSLMRAGARDFIMKDRIGRLIPAIERELSDVRRRQRYVRAEEDQRELSRRVAEEHARLEQKEIELGALNRLFQQQMAAADRSKIENQALLKRLGGLILDAVEERHQNGQLPETLPGTQDRPTTA